jgi:dUTP pyrophosphatase
MRLNIQKLDTKAKMPEYAKDGDSGFDLCACTDTHIVIESGKRQLISTGLAFQLEQDGKDTLYEIQIRPRSGLALKNGITVLNTPGTVDSGYRGEVCVILMNNSSSPFVVSPGMRIAQGVVCPVQRVEIVEVESVDESERGSSGFGSTGC